LWEVRGYTELLRFDPEPGLLMRPEHSETKTETETRECETEIETETKNLLWDRNQKLRDRDQTETSPVMSSDCRWK